MDGDGQVARREGALGTRGGEPPLARPPAAVGARQYQPPAAAPAHARRCSSARTMPTCCCRYSSSRRWCVLACEGGGRAVGGGRARRCAATAGNRPALAPQLVVHYVAEPHTRPYFIYDATISCEASNGAGPCSARGARPLFRPPAPPAPPRIATPRRQPGQLHPQLGGCAGAPALPPHHRGGRRARGHPSRAQVSHRRRGHRRPLFCGRRAGALCVRVLGSHREPCTLPLAPPPPCAPRPPAPGPPRRPQAFLCGLLLTEVFKVTAGRLRPDFLARCQPENPSSWPLQYPTNADPFPNPDATYPCTQTGGSVTDGRKSFPSGGAGRGGGVCVFLCGGGGGLRGGMRVGGARVLAHTPPAAHPTLPSPACPRPPGHTSSAFSFAVYASAYLIW